MVFDKNDENVVYSDFPIPYPFDWTDEPDKNFFMLKWDHTNRMSKNPLKGKSHDMTKILSKKW